MSRERSRWAHFLAPPVRAHHSSTGSAAACTREQCLSSPKLQSCLQTLKTLRLPKEDLTLLTEDKAAARIHVTFMGSALQVRPDFTSSRMLQCQSNRRVVVNSLGSLTVPAVHGERPNV